MTTLDAAKPVAAQQRRRLGLGGAGAKVGWAVGFAAGWLILMAIFAAIGPLFVTDPNSVDPVNRLAAPGTPGHWLGTDNLGRDMLARIVHGTKYSLAFGLVPAIFALFVGGSLGLIAGYAGRIANMAIMRVMDVLYTFPPVLVALAVVGILGPGFLNCLVALTVYLIAPVCRVTEAATVNVAHNAYIDAARLSGASEAMILLRQVVPNVFPQIMAYLTSVLGVMIVIGAGLSFLGLGVAPPTAEWGLMLNELRTVMFLNPWLAAAPGVFIFLTSVSFNLLGEALERRVALVTEA